jgi:ankyrin repeat protein
MGRRHCIWHPIEHVHVHLAQFLVEHGADVAAHNKQGSTPLHWLSSRGNVDFPSSLNLTDNVATQDTDYNSLYLEPSERAYVDLAKFLVEQGANMAAQDEHGSTPSHFVSKNDHVELAQFLVEHIAVATAHAMLQTNEPTTT